MYLLEEDVNKFEKYLNKFIECENDGSFSEPEEGSSVDYFF